MMKEVLHKGEYNGGKSSFPKTAADILSSFRNNFESKEEINNVEKEGNVQTIAAKDVLSSFRNNYDQDKLAKNTEDSSLHINDQYIDEEDRKGKEGAKLLLLFYF